RIAGEARRTVQERARRGPLVAAEAAFAGAREGANRPGGRIVETESVGTVVDDDEGVRGTEDRDRGLDSRRDRRAPVAGVAGDRARVGTRRPVHDGPDVALEIDLPDAVVARVAEVD